METEKMQFETKDSILHRIEKVMEIFPECVNESKDVNGEVKRAINLEKLIDLMNGFSQNSDERFEFSWVGKREAIIEANKPIRKTLRPLVESSHNWDKTENIYIRGDNLEAMKLLQESYLNKIKVVYIDPPYNTGNDFVYRDDFEINQEEYRTISGEISSTGERMFRNTESNGRFHSSWCSMMYSRLSLARNMLSEDGLIFISIDDNEVHNLRNICDEVFGNSNFVATIVWQKKYAATNDAKGFSTTHDYIVVYAKKISSMTRNLLPRTEEQNAAYKHDDGDGKGLWRSDNLLVKSFSQSGVYPITNPNTGVDYYPPEGSCWRASRETMKEWLTENRIYFGKDGKGAPQLKRYLNEVQQGRVPITWWPFEEVGHNDAANKEMKALFGTKTPFDTPKPSTLIKQIIQIASDKDSYVMDFFSGSATTADAVMQLNAEDGGNRKFILIQVQEECTAGSYGEKAGYSNICEIGEERIRLAGKKILDLNQDCGVDVGFRVFEVDDSNMKDVYYAPADMEQGLLAMLESNIKEDRTDLDLLFGCLLEWGLPLSLPYTSESIEGCTVHTYNDGDLIACFDENIPDSVIKTIAKRQPLRAVFRDSSFENSPSKINVGEVFKLLAPDTRVKVI